MKTKLAMRAVAVVLIMYMPSCERVFDINSIEKEAKTALTAARESNNSGEHLSVEKLRHRNPIYVRILLNELQPRDEWALDLLESLVVANVEGMTALVNLWRIHEERAIALCIKALNDHPWHEGDCIEELGKRGYLEQKLVKDTFDADCAKRGDDDFGIRMSWRMTGSEDFRLRIVYVCPGGQAENGGLKSGDIVTSVDGLGRDELYERRYIMDRSIRSMRFDVIRAGKAMSIVVKRGPR